MATRQLMNPKLITLALFLFTVQLGSAQEEEESKSQRSLLGYDLIYIDAPLAIQPNIDPVFEPIPDSALVQAENFIDPEDDPEFMARLDSIREYASALEQIESESGIWSPILIEELSALGDLQQQLGSHADAIDSFDRAIHVNRINDGLHTLSQIPTVEKLIESYLALGEWEQADLYYNYLFYIQQKTYGPNDPRLILVLDRVASWNIQAFNIGFGESLGLRLSTAQILYSAASRMVGVHFGKSDERFVSYLKSLANSAYLVAIHPELMQELARVEYRNDRSILLGKLDVRGAVIPLGFRVGERALMDIASVYAGEEDSIYEFAEAVAEIGDWYLLFARRNLAYERYQQAWTILQELENGSELIDQLFGQVAALPTFSNSVDGLVSNLVPSGKNEPVNADFADVSLDVTTNGVVRNLELLTERTPQSMPLLSRLLRKVRNSNFRPVIVDGKPVRSNGLHFRYRYWY